MTDATLSIIVAMAHNRAIGFQGSLPWHLPADLKRFKQLTLGHPCIMGRKTFESIVARLGTPLPGRTSIVISRHGYTYDGAIACANLEDAIESGRALARRDNVDEIFICGGAEIYHQALPRTQRIYLTEVGLSPEADTFFPPLSPQDWQTVSDEAVAGSPRCHFKILERTS